MIFFFAFKGTLVGELKATDADSSENDNNKVRFDHFGSESPASTDGANRFAVNEAGQVSVVSSLDKESESTITFVVRARDGFDLPNGKFTSFSNDIGCYQSSHSKC